MILRLATVWLASCIGAAFCAVTLSASAQNTVIEPPAAPPPLSEPAAPASPAPSAPSPDPMEEPSADASNAEEVQLTASPVLYLESNALWDDNFVTMRESFAALSKEVAALGLKSSRPPLAVYLDTDDAGFKFQAMLVLDAPPPAGRQPSDSRMKFGLSPSGKALKFINKGSFDDLDSLYEAISGYLDEKRLTMRPPYIEEYLTPLTDSTDQTFSLNIFVLIDETKRPSDAPAAPGEPVPAVPVPAQPQPAPPATTPLPQSPPTAG